MDHLLGSSMVGLMATSSKRAYVTGCVTQVLYPELLPLLQATADPYPCRYTGLAQSLWSLWVLVHTRFCLSPLSISGRYGV